MPNAAKTAAVAELRDAFRASSAAVLTEYRGLTVAQLNELRSALAGNATYAVVKNTLTKIAARDAGVPDIEALLQGPSAIAFVMGDPVVVAKGIRDFARANPLLVVKGGVLEGRALSADEVRRLADLESRDVLLARLAGAFQAALSGAVALVAAPLSQAARLMAALQAKAEEEPGVLAAAAPPATASAAEDATEPVPAAGSSEADGEPESDSSADSEVAGDAADAAVAADAVAREIAESASGDAPA